MNATNTQIMNTELNKVILNTNNLYNIHLTLIRIKKNYVNTIKCRIFII